MSNVDIVNITDLMNYIKKTKREINKKENEYLKKGLKEFSKRHIDIIDNKIFIQKCLIHYKFIDLLYYLKKNFNINSVTKLLFYDCIFSNRVDDYKNVKMDKFEAIEIKNCFFYTTVSFSKLLINNILIEKSGFGEQIGFEEIDVRESIQIEKSSLIKIKYLNVNINEKLNINNNEFIFDQKKIEIEKCNINKLNIDFEKEYQKNNIFPIVHIKNCTLEKSYIFFSVAKLNNITNINKLIIRNYKEIEMNNIKNKGEIKILIDKKMKDDSEKSKERKVNINLLENNGELEINNSVSTIINFDVNKQENHTKNMGLIVIKNEKMNRNKFIKFNNVINSGRIEITNVDFCKKYDNEISKSNLNKWLEDFCNINIENHNFIFSKELFEFINKCVHILCSLNKNDFPKQINNLNETTYYNLFYKYSKLNISKKDHDNYIYKCKLLTYKKDIYNKFSLRKWLKHNVLSISNYGTSFKKLLLSSIIVITFFTVVYLICGNIMYNWNIIKCFLTASAKVF